MIETVVNLRPREHWPKRHMRYDDALEQTEAVVNAMLERQWLAPPDDRRALVNDATIRRWTISTGRSAGWPTRTFWHSSTSWRPG